MRPVDERLVKMKLENADFKSKARETLGILADIKNGFGKNADVSGMTHLESSVDKISSKFSALGLIGMTALMNITNKAVDAGIQLAKSLTIDPVKQGFREYELKLNSVQTIMAGTGRDLADVNDQLELLNEYSDQTIYSFSDMTENIGKFTNAGVGLEESVQAIMGISNAAALSGSNAQQASAAMYNFSQALSKGHVGLIDWKSIENAQMATVGFKEQLIQTAVSLGTVTDAGDGMYKTLDGNLFNATKNFNEVLQDQWMTSDVLTTSLAKYSDATTDVGKKAFAAAQDIKTFSQLMDTTKEAIASGWAESWEIIIGDFDEAKEFWTGVAEPIGKFITGMSDARNNMLRQMKDADVFENVVKGLGNTFKAIGSIFGTVGKAFKAVFPPMSVDGIAKVAKGFADFTGKLKLSDEALAGMTSTFEWAFKMIKSGIDSVKEVGNTLLKLIPDNLLERVAGIASGAGLMVTGFAKTIPVTKTFNSIMETLGETFDFVSGKIEKALDFLDGKFGQKATIATEAIKQMREQGVKGVWKQSDVDTTNKLAEAFEKISSAVDKVKDAFGKAWDKVSKFMSGITINDAMGGGFIAGSIVILTKVVQFMDGLTGVFKESKKWSKTLQDFTGSIGKSLETFTSQVKYNNLMKIAGALAILVVSLKLMETMDIKDIGKGLAVLGTSLGGMLLAMKLIEKLDLNKFSGGSLAIAVIGISTAVSILASAIGKLSDMDAEQLLNGSLTLMIMMTALTGMFAVMSQWANSKTNIDTQAIVINLLGISVVVSVVARAIEKLGKIDGDKLLNGTLAVAAIMTLLIGSFALLGKMKLPSLRDMQAFTKFTGGLATSAIAIAVFTVSLRLLVDAVKEIGEIKTDELVKGIVGLSAILLAVGVFQRISGGIGTFSAGVGIAVIAASIILLVKPIKELGEMDYKVLEQGLISLSIAILAIGIAVLAAKNGFSGAAGMLIAVGALTLLLPVIEKFGKMPLETLAIGMIAMGGALAILVLALNAMQYTAVGTGALLVAVLAMNLLVVPLAALAAIGLTGVLVALVGLAGTLTILTVSIAAFGLVAIALSPAIGMILALTGAMLAIGLAVMLGGAGLTLLATALGAFAAVAALSVASAISAFNILMDGLIDLAPKVGKWMTAIFDTIVDVIVKNSPKIAIMAGTIIVAFMEGILKYLPKIIVLAGAIIIAFILGIGEQIPLIALAAVSLIATFIAGMSAALKTEGPKIIKEVLVLVGEIVTLVVQGLIAALDALLGWIPGVSEKLANASEIASDAVREHFDGNTLGDDMAGDMIKGINKNKPVYRKSGEEVTKEFERGVLDIDMMPIGDKKGKELAGGAGSSKIMDLMESAGLDLGGGLTNSFGSVDLFGAGSDGGGELASGAISPEIQKMMEDAGIDLKDILGDGFDASSLTGSGKEAGQDVVDGVNSKQSAAKQAGGNLAKQADSGARTGNAYGAGTAFGQGFANGISAMTVNVKAAATTLGNTANKAIKRSIEARSPSRVTRRFGSYFGQGFALGIHDKARSVGEAAAEMAGKANDAIDGFINRIANDFIPKEEEAYEFRLKPILDLDELESFGEKSFKLNPDTSGLNKQLGQLTSVVRQNDDKNPQQPVNNSNVVNHNYEISVTASGEVPADKLKQMASTIQAEIKRLNDKDRMSRGEAVYY